MSGVLLFNLVAFSIAIAVFIVALCHGHDGVAAFVFVAIILVAIGGLLMVCVDGIYRQELTYYEVGSVVKGETHIMVERDEFTLNSNLVKFYNADKSNIVIKTIQDFNHYNAKNGLKNELCLRKDIPQGATIIQ